MHEQQCCYCGKWIKNSRWLGTLHLCVSPAERARVDEVIRPILMQREIVRRWQATGAPHVDLGGMSGVSLVSSAVDSEKIS